MKVFRSFVLVRIQLLIYHLATAGHNGCSSFASYGQICFEGILQALALTLGITKKVESCPIRAKKGDQVAVHYTGKLADGTVFDDSHNRGAPIEFMLGVGRVIPGWDQGILGMCIGEKRKLVIPPHLGYGSAGAGAVIPPDATLVFNTELVAINGVTEETLGEAEPEIEPVVEPEAEPEPGAEAEPDAESEEKPEAGPKEDAEPEEDAEDEIAAETAPASASGTGKAADFEEEEEEAPEPTLEAETPDAPADAVDMDGEQETVGADATEPFEDIEPQATGEQPTEKVDL
jgi:FK506-binding protein 2